MNYLRGALSAASQYYKDINPSTLTGAIDVIVIQRPGEDGQPELACSPFHVRFGKWQVLRPGEKKVDVLVNGHPIPFNMKIGEAGEAFFVFETDGDVPEDLITSPLLEATTTEPPQTTLQSETLELKQEAGQGNRGTLAELGPPSLVEPEFLDLNETGATKPVPPSGLSLSRPLPPTEHQQHTPPASPNLKKLSLSPVTLTDVHHSPANARQSNFPPPTACTPKEAQSPAHGEEHRVVEKTGPVVGVHPLNTNTSNQRTHGWEGIGDEALPPVRAGEGLPPPVVYFENVAYDNIGYHVKDRSDRTVTLASSRFTSEPLASEEQIGTEPFLEGDGRHQRTPSASRSPSPESCPSASTHLQPLPPFPTLRASSEPLEESPANSLPQYSWEWGAFPQKSPMKASFSTLRDASDSHRSASVPPELDSERTSPSGVARNDSEMPAVAHDGDLTPDEQDGKRFLLHIGDRKYAFELSTCGKLSGGSDLIEDARRFRDNQVSYKRFIKSAAVVHDRDLVMRWNDKYFRRGDGSPILASLPAWRDAALSKPANIAALSEEEPLSSSDEYEPIRRANTETLPKRGSSSWVRWWKLSRSEHSLPTSQTTDDIKLRKELTPSHTSSSIQHHHRRSKSSIVSAMVPPPQKRYAKTLRLTSDQLKSLELHQGANTITFSLATSGVVACTARIFVWDSTDQVVVSDIDGTITKSDALGHVFTMIGRDWTHLGVAKLYTDIYRNGYKIMYLTSRAIGQADSTRDYLKGINQNNYQLPEGPVVMSPDRLMASLHREVIMRKPEIFKMACLRDIQRLFGNASERAFYAGFGNRITDALSYRSVNVPSARIFTIDSSGEVKMELLELAGYKSSFVFHSETSRKAQLKESSSYIHMTDLVDQMFPPIHKTWTPEYTDFNYWKAPMQEFTLPDLAPPSPALSARSDTSGQSTFSRIRNFSLGRQSSKAYALSPPVTQKGTSDGQEHHLRQVTSIERFSNRLGGLPERFEESEQSESTLADSEYEVDRQARKRMSMDSMPGSLPGSHDSHHFMFGDEEDDDEEADMGDYDDDEGPDSEEQAAHDAFDDDFMATGEMQHVPFL